MIIPIEKVNLAVDAGSCVYCLYLDGNVVYVGQTINLTTRLTNHKASRDFDSFSFFSCSIDDLDTLEAIKIVELSPPENKTLPKNDLFICDKDAKKILLNTITELIDGKEVFIGKVRTEKTGSIIYYKNKTIEDIVSKISILDVK